MKFVDIVTCVGTLATVISVIYAALAYHFPNTKSRRVDNSTSPNLADLLWWLPAVVAVCAAVFNYINCNVLTADTSYDDRSGIAFGYENDAQHIIHADPPGRDVVYIGIKAKRRLDGALPYLTVIRPYSDNEKAPPWSVNPLRSTDRMQLGWAISGEAAFRSRSIPSSDQFIPFNIFDSGPVLRLFTNSSSANLDAVFRNIPKGDYFLTFEVDDKTLDHGASQNFHMKWTGQKDGFSMEKIP